MKDNAFEKIEKNDAATNEWDMSEVEYVGAEKNEKTSNQQNEIDENSKEKVKNHDVALLKEIFPKFSDEDEETHDQFILDFYNLVPRGEGESDDEYRNRMMEKYLGVDNHEKDDENDWEAFTKGTKEVKKLEQDDSLFMFLTSADGGYAVKKDKAVDTFIEKVEAADNSKEFNDAKMLALAIQNDRNKFSEDEVKKLTEFMQTPAYQKKLFNAYIEQNKKIIEKRSEDLKRCLDEVEREKKGGLFNQLSNRKAIKEAEMRVQWTKNGIKEAEEALLYYSEKLKELENGGNGISADQLAERFMAGKNKAA